MGAHFVPAALRAAGWEIVTLRERYGEQEGQGVQDPEWIKEAAGRGEVLLCKDKRIARRPLEAQELAKHSARGFAMGSGELTGDQMVARLLRHQQAIFRRAQRDPGPFIVSVAESHLQTLKLHTRSGRI